MQHNDDDDDRSQYGGSRPVRNQAPRHQHSSVQRLPHSANSSQQDPLSHSSETNLHFEPNKAARQRGLLGSCPSFMPPQTAPSHTQPSLGQHNASQQNSTSKWRVGTEINKNDLISTSTSKSKPSAPVTGSQPGNAAISSSNPSGSRSVESNLALDSKALSNASLSVQSHQNETKTRRPALLSTPPKIDPSVSNEQQSHSQNSSQDCHQPAQTVSKLSKMPLLNANPSKQKAEVNKPLHPTKAPLLPLPQPSAPSTESQANDVYSLQSESQNASSVLNYRQTSNNPVSQINNKPAASLNLTSTSQTSKSYSTGKSLQSYSTSGTSQLSSQRENQNLSAKQSLYEHYKSQVTSSSQLPGSYSVSRGSNEQSLVSNTLDAEALKDVLKNASALSSALPSKRGDGYNNNVDDEKLGSDRVTTPATKFYSDSTDEVDKSYYMPSNNAHDSFRSSSNQASSTNVSRYPTSYEYTDAKDYSSATSSKSYYNYKHSNATATQYYSSPQSTIKVGSNETHNNPSDSNSRSTDKHIKDQPTSSSAKSSVPLSTVTESKGSMQESKTVTTDNSSASKFAVNLSKLDLTKGMSKTLLEQLRQIRKEYSKMNSDLDADGSADSTFNNNELNVLPGMTLIDNDQSAQNSEDRGSPSNQLINSWPPEPTQSQQSSINSSSMNYDSTTMHTYYTPKSTSHQQDYQNTDASQPFDGMSEDAQFTKPLLPSEIESSIRPSTKMTLSQYKAFVFSKAGSPDSLLPLPKSMKNTYGRDPTPITGAASLLKDPDDMGSVLNLPVSPREMAYSKLVNHSREQPIPYDEDDYTGLPPPRHHSSFSSDDGLPPPRQKNRPPPSLMSLSVQPPERSAGYRSADRRPDFNPHLDRPNRDRRRESSYDDQQRYGRRLPPNVERYRKPLLETPSIPPRNDHFGKRGGPERESPTKRQKTWPRPESEKAPISEDLLPYVEMKCCDICNVEYTHPTHAKSHLIGKNHHKKLKVLGLPVPDYCIDKSKPSLQLKKLQAKAEEGDGAAEGEDYEDEEVPWPDWMQEKFLDDFCGVCNVPLSSILTADSHYAGKKHLKKCNVAYMQRQKAESTDHPSSRFYCEICHIHCSSDEIMEQHKAGTKHRQTAYYHRARHDKPFVSEVRITEVEVTLVDKKKEAEMEAEDFASMAAKMNGL